MAREKELTLDDKFDLLLSVLAEHRGGGGISKDDLKEILDANSKGIQKAMKPENTDHPGLSVFSHPEGDKAKPKGELPFQFLYNGYPCHMFPETETWREWELMKLVTPGEYTVIRKDGSMMTVTAKGEYNAKQELTKLDVTFPVSREDKSHIPPKSVVLYQLVHPDNPRKRFVEAMTAFLNAEMGFADGVPA